MFTVYGFGKTTNEALQDARLAMQKYTEGDKRHWFVQDESYVLDLVPDHKPVVCELTLALVETVA